MATPPRIRAQPGVGKGGMGMAPGRAGRERGYRDLWISHIRLVWGFLSRVFAATRRAWP
jgi:hypothetical protein